MKIWEKVNNITGHSSKARYLVEYVNAGAKFILSSLPEKFLWTVATETEINGFDTSGNSEIGSGSKISYDKILAVYRYDSGKKRVCAEAPDKSIHIFDEGSSLLRATEMFPKFYKLGGNPTKGYADRLKGKEHECVQICNSTGESSASEGSQFADFCLYALNWINDAWRERTTDFPDDEYLENLNQNWIDHISGSELV